MKPERNLRILARVARVLTTPFVRYEIRGGRCLSEVEVGVVAVNHRSLFDVAAGLICFHHFGRSPRLMVERKYVEGRLIGPFARALGCIPVDRQAGGGSSVEAALEALAAGIPIVIMPEGRLHWDPANPHSTAPARGGVSRLARAADVPVLPAALSGTERVMPAGKKVPRLNPFRRKTVTCNVADDVIWLTSDDHHANAEQVMAAVRSLMI